MKKSKNVNKRIKSTTRYIDALSERYNKLNIIRIDLSYKKPYSNNISLEDANADISHMFNNKRSKPTIFKHMVGYVCKREYTKDKGVHIHASFIFDGQKVKNDAYKGEQLGEYWNKITKEKGIFHNCNRNNYKQNGIGILDRSDTNKRKIIDDKVISYLCKEEQSIEGIKHKKQAKAFTRGTLPRSKKKQ